jgi:hypothetical protein
MSMVMTFKFDEMDETSLFNMEYIEFPTQGRFH